MSEAGGIRAGKAFVELSLLNRIGEGLQQAESQLSGFAGSIGSSLFLAAEAGAALSAAVVGGVGLAVSNFTQQGSALTDMAGRTGLTVQALAGLGYAAEQTGASMADVEIGSKKASKFIEDVRDGGKGASKTLGELGIKADSLKSGKFGDHFQELALAVAGIDDPAKRAAAAMEVFGKSGTQLLPMFSEGREGLKKMLDRAGELGIVMSDEDAAAADKFGDSLADLWKSVMGIGNTIAAVLVPPLQGIVNAIDPVIIATRRWIKETLGASDIFKAFSGLIAGGDFAGTWDLAVKALNVGWQETLAFMSQAWTDFRTNWIGSMPELEQFAVDAWAGIVSAWDSGVQMVKDAWAATIDFFSQNTPKISDVFGREVTKVSDIWYGVQEYFVKAWGQLERVWIETVAFIREAWETSDFKKMFDDMVASFIVLGKEIEMAWNVTVQALGDWWGEFAKDVSATCDTMRAVFTSMTGWFGDNFGSEIDSMKLLWSDFLGFFTKGWRNAQNVVGQQFAYMIGGQDAVQAIVDEQARIDRIEKETAAAAKVQRDKDRADELAASKEKEKAALDAIAARETAAKDAAAIEAYYADASRGVAQTAAQKAQADLAKAVAAVKAPVVEAKAFRPDVTKELAQTMGASSFNVAVAGQMGGGGVLSEIKDQMKRGADLQAKQNEKTDKLIDAVTNGKGIFV